MTLGSTDRRGTSSSPWFSTPSPLLPLPHCLSRGVTSKFVEKPSWTTLPGEGGKGEATKSQAEAASGTRTRTRKRHCGTEAEQESPLPCSELSPTLRTLGFVGAEARNRALLGTEASLRFALCYDPRLLIPDLDDTGTELVAVELAAPDGTWLDDRHVRHVLLPRPAAPGEDDYDVVDADAVRRLVRASFDPCVRPARSTLKLSAYRPFYAPNRRGLLVMLVPRRELTGPNHVTLRDFLAAAPKPGTTSLEG